MRGSYDLSKQAILVVIIAVTSFPFPSQGNGLSNLKPQRLENASIALVSNQTKGQGIEADKTEVTVGRENARVGIYKPMSVDRGQEITDLLELYDNEEPVEQIVLMPPYVVSSQDQHQELHPALLRGNRGALDSLGSSYPDHGRFLSSHSGPRLNNLPQKQQQEYFQQPQAETRGTAPQPQQVLIPTSSPLQNLPSYSPTNSKISNPPNSQSPVLPEVYHQAPSPQQTSYAQDNQTSPQPNVPVQQQANQQTVIQHSQQQVTRPQVRATDGQRQQPQSQWYQQQSQSLPQQQLMSSPPPPAPQAVLRHSNNMAPQPQNLPPYILGYQPDPQQQPSLPAPQHTYLQPSLQQISKGQHEGEYKMYNVDSRHQMSEASKSNPHPPPTSSSNKEVNRPVGDPFNEPRRPWKGVRSQPVRHYSPPRPLGRPYVHRPEIKGQDSDSSSGRVREYRPKEVRGNYPYLPPTAESYVNPNLQPVYLQYQLQNIEVNRFKGPAHDIPRETGQPELPEPSYRQIEKAVPIKPQEPNLSNPKLAALPSEVPIRHSIDSLTQVNFKRDEPTGVKDSKETNTTLEKLPREPQRSPIPLRDTEETDQEILLDADAERKAPHQRANPIPRPYYNRDPPPRSNNGPLPGPHYPPRRYEEEQLQPIQHTFYEERRPSRQGTPRPTHPRPPQPLKRPYYSYQALKSNPSSIRGNPEYYYRHPGIPNQDLRRPVSSQDDADEPWNRFPYQDQHGVTNEDEYLPQRYPSSPNLLPPNRNEYYAPLLRSVYSDEYASPARQISQGYLVQYRH